MCPKSTLNRTSPTSLESEVQLLVEGRDLEGFCEGLIQHLKLEDIQIHNFGGVTELRTFLGGFTKRSGFSRVASIGIVRDAEEDATNALKSVQGCLEHAELSVPNTTGQPVGDHPAITVMILPDGSRPGMLETLLCETFSDENVRTCVDMFFECVEGLQPGIVRKPYKARARAYLATKPDPHLSVGVAAKRKYWNLDHPVLQPLRSFLREIAAIPHFSRAKR